jgi:hypothetical protein
MAGPGGVYWPRGNTILDQVNFDLGFWEFELEEDERGERV